MDQWEPQYWRRSPGNLFSRPRRIAIEPEGKSPVRLVCDQLIPPIPAIPDTEHVERMRFKSQILSSWRGQPISLGAIVSPPKDYDRLPNVRSPVNYIQGHFSTRAPVGFLERFLEKTSNPAYEGSVNHAHLKPHCWGPSAADLPGLMLAPCEKYSLQGTDLKSWRYR